MPAGSPVPQSLQLSLRVWASALAAAAASAVPLAVPRSLGAQDVCPRRELTPATAAQFAGRPLAAVRILVAPLTPFPGPFGPVTRLHTTTREGVVRRELLFGHARTVDTAQVLETLRNLRAAHLFADVHIDAEECGLDSAVTLLVATRDAWTIRGRVRAGATGSSVIELDERNLLGTGRGIGAFAQSGPQRALGLTLRDPQLVGTPLRAAAAFASYSDGRVWRGAVRTPDRSVGDPWRAAFTTTQSFRASTNPADSLPYSLRRRGTAFLVARRVSASATAVLAMIIGAEQEATVLSTTPTGQVIGAIDVARSFVAGDVGLARRSAAYTTIDWLIPRGRPADLPLATEWEGVVGVGHDSASGGLIAHPDAWIGRIWALPTRVLVGADIWASAYQTKDSAANGSLRGALSIYAYAPHGLWIVRAAAERLVNPDPDVYALATLDPILRSVAPRLKLASEAFVGSVERTAHLWDPAARSFLLDGAGFVAVSVRRGGVDPDVDALENAFAVVLGLGLRTVATTANQSPWRLDIGYPVLRSANLPRRLLIAISVSPWIAAGRGRDGVRAI